MSLDTLTAGLNPDEQQELVDVLDYLAERLDNNQGQSPEGGIGQILNTLSPKVRQRFAQLSDFVEQPRQAPFQPKRSERQNLDALGLDPDNGSIVKDALDGVYVMGKLQQRMGVDKPSNAPPTRRESIEAALRASNYENMKGA